MATFPPMYTSFVDAELDTNAPVSEEIVRKLIRNANLLGHLACIGQIRMAQPTIPGSPIPTTKQFQFCNGAAITDVISPLNGTSTPALADKYLCGAPDSSSNGNPGQATADFSHNHGGSTGNFHHVLGPRAGTTLPVAQLDHVHTIPDRLGPITLDLKYMYFSLYLKIN